MIYFSMATYKVDGVFLLYMFIPEELIFFNFLHQWDDPHVIPAKMTLEVSELFTRELTRVISMSFGIFHF